MNAELQKKAESRALWYGLCLARGLTRAGWGPREVYLALKGRQGRHFARALRAVQREAGS